MKCSKKKDIVKKESMNGVNWMKIISDSEDSGYSIGGKEKRMKKEKINVEEDAEENEENEAHLAKIIYEMNRLQKEKKELEKKCEEMKNEYENERNLKLRNTHLLEEQLIDVRKERKKIEDENKEIKGRMNNDSKLTRNELKRMNEQLNKLIELKQSEIEERNKKNTKDMYNELRDKLSQVKEMQKEMIKLQKENKEVKEMLNNKKRSTNVIKDLYPQQIPKELRRRSKSNINEEMRRVAPLTEKNIERFLSERRTVEEKEENDDESDLASELNSISASKYDKKSERPIDDDETVISDIFFNKKCFV
ncbi:hypothetical protein SNEBB_006144 [Seison nebaliae]|nr:hypothetical protein SNEBB_006144 [Seison nebaliae]